MFDDRDEVRRDEFVKSIIQTTSGLFRVHLNL